MLGATSMLGGFEGYVVLLNEIETYELIREFVVAMYMVILK